MPSSRMTSSRLGLAYDKGGFRDLIRSFYNIISSFCDDTRCLHDITIGFRALTSCFHDIIVGFRALTSCFHDIIIGFHDLSSDLSFFFHHGSYGVLYGCSAEFCHFTRAFRDFTADKLSKTVK